MFRIMLQKMWHKKWMTLSLLIGCILLIATAVSFPLYEKAAYNRMLQDEFNIIASKEGRWPVLMSMSANLNKDKAETIEKMEGFIDSVYEELGVSEHQTILHYVLQRAVLVSDMNREEIEGLGINLAGLTGIEEQVNIISGECFSESGMSEDGCIEVIVTEDFLVSQGLLVGETLTLKGLKDVDGNIVRIKIQGVFRPVNESDVFWQDGDIQLSGRAFMNMTLLKELFVIGKPSNYTIMCDYYALMNYEDIHYDQVADIVSKTNQFCEKSEFKNAIEYPDYMDTLDSYLRKINRVSATLLILQIPVLIMLCAFLLMITGQMYEMERNEISVIKSRGSYRTQIFRLYLYQSAVLTFAGGILGIPLGIFFSKVLGAARNFLEFDFSTPLGIEFSTKTVVYAVLAMFVSLCCIAMPAIKHSKVTIVNLKRNKAVKAKKLWEKIYLDIILLGISLYGYYNFHKNSANLSSAVLQGESLDPLLYLSSSLFILGLGLLFLRVHPYIVLLIYKIGKKHWKSASYISFQENIRNGRKQQLIMLFLIMTISLGIYHAAVARTILANAVENTEYLNGSDVVIKEVWPSSYVEDKIRYSEPDYTKYMTMDIAKSCTKVYYSDAGYCSLKQSDRQVITIMGIHTKEFGSITQMQEGLLDEHYYEYLNKLALAPNGVLVSSNFRDLLGFDIGESITYRNASGAGATGKIVGFVDYFPGFAPLTREVNPDGSAYEKDNFLVVTHFDVLQKKWGTTPYEIWIDLKDECDAADVSEWIEENDISLVKYVNKEENLQNTMDDPLLQGTNGVLSMGFIVTLLLCAIGYLIYWIMAIKERELMFGVLRACGFHKGELIQMLFNEQIFCGIFSVFTGIGIGRLSASMFVPILQQAYASEDQVLPMKLIMNAADMYRLYGVIAATMLLALGVLVVIIFKMNVTKALKLGEE